ncbi:MAG: M56 family metallopeptidase, partial [Limisphaerales bacterium]
MNAFGWLWETTWQASLLVLLVLAVQRTFRRWLTAEWRDAIWLLVVIRLCVPVLPESSFSVFNAVADHGAVPEQLAMSASATKLDGAVGVSEQTVSFEDNPIVTTSSSPVESFNWASLIKVVWSLGAVPTLGWALAAYFFVRRRIAGLPEVSSGRLVMILDSARRAMGVRRAVRLHESSDGFGPAVVGLWRPRLVIPIGLADELSDEELRYVFLHECGHLRRLDLGLNWLISLLQAAHWFNPVLLWAFRRMKADRELACDEMTMRVSNDSKAYGETIVRLLERAMFGGKPGLIGIVDKQADIRERIQMIAAFHRSSRWSVIAVTLMFALGLTMLTDAKQASSAPKIVRSPVIVSETGTGIQQADLLERVENLVWHSREREHWARSNENGSEDFEKQSSLWQQAL